MKIHGQRAVVGCSQDIARVKISDQPAPTVVSNGQGVASRQGLYIGIKSVRLWHAAKKEEPHMSSRVGTTVPGMSTGTQCLNR